MEITVATAKRTGHYVVSTHWDREWYESFQDYRFRLVNLMDELLDTMRRDPDFRYFQLDGQAIPVEDYLEARPEREEQLRSVIEAGRLRVGPWYVLPDEWLVSGESMIRNLQTGLAVAARYGAPAGSSRVGFVCDLFGHISQLPQIFRGFGIDNAILWRGTRESVHGAMFRWRAPDGSEVLAYRFSPLGGYCSYAFKVRKGLLPDQPFALEPAEEGLRELVEYETGRCPTSSFLLFDGGDHMEIEPQTTALLKRMNAKLQDVEIVHSHLDGFVEDLREQREQITKTFTGELREIGEIGDEAWLIPGVLSSRIQLKQANARCDNELCLWAEPFSTFAAGLGVPYPKRYLELAWRYLLQNHPHDSICGCSIDQVHKDMEYRFDQSLGISSHLTRDALSAIAGRVELPELGEKDFALCVFNPSSEAVDGPVDLTLQFPHDIDTVYQEFFGFEPKIGFRLYDAAGAELPYQYVGQRRDRMGFKRVPRKFPTKDQRHEVDVSFAMKIPAYGYTTVICRPLKEPTRHLGSMQVDDHTIENAYLRVSVNPNGTLRVTEKRSGQTYDQLLTIEERADIGDGWYHGVAVNDRIYSSTASPAEVSLITDGIAKATLSIRVNMQVPDAFDFGNMKRSDRLAPLVVTHEVTLRKGAEFVEVRTVIDNTIRDHRVRVLMPTGAAAAKTYLADGAFDVLERAIPVRADNARFKELDVETRSQQTWTAVHDSKRGLAVVSTGLPESAVRDLPDRPIALTLLRSFLRAVFTSGNEGGEIQGHHEFNYRIVPLQGRPDVAKLFRVAQGLAAGVRAVVAEPLNAVENKLPMTHAFLKAEPAQAVVTAVHRRTASELGSIRLFNPTDRDLTAKLEMPAAAAAGARRTDLEGKPGEPLAKPGVPVQVTIKPKEIATVQWAE
jgi:alpha-mannosidase